MTEKLEIVIIELEKITEKIYQGAIKKDSKEAIWAKFFLKPKELEGEELRKNSDLKEIKTLYEDLIDDYDLAWVAIRRQMARMDEASLKAELEETATEEGLKKGLKKGIKKGRKEGLKEGLKEGRELGQKEKQKEIAKKMLKEGLNIDLIEKITNLSKEEIEKLLS